MQKLEGKNSQKSSENVVPVVEICCLLLDLFYVVFSYLSVGLAWIIWNQWELWTTLLFHIDAAVWALIWQ